MSKLKPKRVVVLVELSDGTIRSVAATQDELYNTLFLLRDKNGILQFHTEDFSEVLKFKKNDIP